MVNEDTLLLLREATGFPDAKAYTRVEDGKTFLCIMAQGLNSSIVLSINPEENVPRFMAICRGLVGSLHREYSERSMRSIEEKLRLHGS